MGMMNNVDSANLALIARHTGQIRDALTKVIKQNEEIIELLKADVRANDFQARMVEHDADRRLAPYGNSAQKVVDETRQRSQERRSQGFGQGPIR